VDWAEAALAAPAGPGWSCRFACACLDAAGGRRRAIGAGGVWLAFNPRLTLREAARRGADGFRSGPYLAEWVARGAAAGPVSLPRPPLRLCRPPLAACAPAAALRSGRL
jgi:hypothetical protein